MPKPSKPSSSSRTAQQISSQGKGSSQAQSDASVSSKNAKPKNRSQAKAKSERPPGESIGTGLVWLVTGIILLGFGAVGFLVYQELLNSAKRELVQVAQGQIQPIAKQFEQTQKATENLASGLQAVQRTKAKTPEPYRKAVTDQASAISAPLMGLGMVSVPNQLFKGNGPSPYVVRKEGTVIPANSQPQALPVPNEKLVIINRNDGQKLPVFTTTNSAQPLWTNTYDSYGAKVVAFTVPITNGKQGVAVAYGEINLGQLAQTIAASNLAKANPDTTLLLVGPDGMIWGNTSSDGGGQAGQSYQTIPSLSNAWAILQTQGTVQSEGKLWINTPLGVPGWQIVAGTSEQKIWMRTLPIVGGAAAGTLLLVGGGMFWFLGSLRRRFGNLSVTERSKSQPNNALPHDDLSPNADDGHPLPPNDSGDYGDATAGDLNHLNQELDDLSLEYPEITTGFGSEVSNPVTNSDQESSTINPVIGAAALGVAVVGGAAVVSAMGHESSSPSSESNDATPPQDYGSDPLSDDDLSLDDLPAHDLMADYADKYALPIADPAHDSVSAVADESFNQSVNESLVEATLEAATQDAVPEYTATIAESTIADADLSESYVDDLGQVGGDADDVFMSETEYSVNDLTDLPNELTNELGTIDDLSANDDVFASAESDLNDNFDDAFAPTLDPMAISVGGISEEEMLALELAEANLAMDNLASNELANFTAQADQNVDQDYVTDITGGLAEAGLHLNGETILQANGDDLESDMENAMEYVPTSTYAAPDDDPFADDPFQTVSPSVTGDDVDPFGTMDLLGNVDSQSVEEESKLEAFDPLMETIGQNVHYSNTDEVFEPLPPLVPQLHESLDLMDDSAGSYGQEEIGEPDWGQTNNEFARPYDGNYADQLNELAELTDDGTYSDTSYEVAAGMELLDDHGLDDEFNSQFNDQLGEQLEPEQFADAGMDYVPQSDAPQSYDLEHDPFQQAPADYTQENYAAEYATNAYPENTYTENYTGEVYAEDAYAGNVYAGDVYAELGAYTPDANSGEAQYFMPQDSGENPIDYASQYQTNEYGETYSADTYDSQYAPSQDAFYDPQQEYAVQTGADYVEQQYTEQEYAAQQYSEEHNQFNYDDAFAANVSSELPELSLDAEDAFAANTFTGNTFTEDAILEDVLPEDAFTSEAAAFDLIADVATENEIAPDLGLNLVEADLGQSPAAQVEDDPFGLGAEDIALADNSFPAVSMGMDDLGLAADPFTSALDDLPLDSASFEPNLGNNLIEMGDETAFSFASLEDSLISSTDKLEQITAGSSAATPDILGLSDLDLSSLSSKEIDLDFLSQNQSGMASELAEPNLDHNLDLLEDDSIEGDFLEDILIAGDIPNASDIGLDNIAQSLAPASSDLSFLDVLELANDSEQPALGSESSLADDPFSDSVFSYSSGNQSDDLDFDSLGNMPPQGQITNPTDHKSRDLIMPAIPDLDMELSLDFDNNDDFFDNLSNDSISNSILELSHKPEVEREPKASEIVSPTGLPALELSGLSLLDEAVDDLFLDDFTSDAPSLSPSNSSIPMANHPFDMDNLHSQYNPRDHSLDDLDADDDFSFDALMLEIEKPLTPKPSAPQNPDHPKKTEP